MLPASSRRDHVEHSFGVSTPSHRVACKHIEGRRNAGGYSAAHARERARLWTFNLGGKSAGSALRGLASMGSSQLTFGEIRSPPYSRTTYPFARPDRSSSYACATRATNSATVTLPSRSALGSIELSETIAVRNRVRSSPIFCASGMRVAGASSCDRRNTSLRCLRTSLASTPVSLRVALQPRMQYPPGASWETPNICKGWSSPPPHS